MKYFKIVTFLYIKIKQIKQKIFHDEYIDCVLIKIKQKKIHKNFVNRKSLLKKISLKRKYSRKIGKVPGGNFSGGEFPGTPPSLLVAKLVVARDIFLHGDRC